MNQEQRLSHVTAGQYRKWTSGPILRRQRPLPYYHARPLLSGGFRTNVFLRSLLSSRNYDGPLQYQLSASCRFPRLPHHLNGPVEYIYCVKLPGFVCHSSQAVESHAGFLGQTFATQPYLHAYSSLGTSNLAATCRMGPTQEYSVVKVGISTSPVHRLHSIMRSFREFGAEDTQFQHFQIGEKDSSADDTVETGKLEDKIIFIHKCCGLGSAESEIRQLIGRQLGQSFQDQFTKSLDKDKKIKQSYVEQVGKTEWVLIKTDLMRWIQQDYRNGNGIMNRSRKLFGPEHCPTGLEFHRQMHTLWVDYRRLSRNVCQGTHNVEIKFSPTDFSYTESI